MDKKDIIRDFAVWTCIGIAIAGVALLLGMAIIHIIH
jgi:hypothetical protein